MALATLSIDLVAQLANLQAGMDKAGRLAEKSAAEIESRYARLKSVAIGLGAVLGGAISVAGLVSFFRSTVSGLDALNDLKDATGASIENLSALEDIAARTGTSMDTVAAGLLKFNKTLTAAKPGSNEADILKSIGLNAAELRRIDPAEALLKTAQALSEYADDGNKARLTQELFGKSTKEVAEFLKELAEKGKLNATVTTQQAEEAERFNKALFAFNKNSEDFHRSIVSNMLPGLNELIDRYKLASNLFGGFGGVLAAGIKEKLNFTDPADGLREYNAQIQKLAANIKGVESGPDRQTKTSQLRVQQLKDELTELVKVADYYAALLSGTPQGAGFVNAVKGKPRLQEKPDKPDKPKKDPKEKIDETTHALAQYVHQLDRELVKTEELSTRNEALLELKRLGALGQNVQVRELVLGLAGEVDLRKQGLEFAKAMTAEMKRQTDEQAALDAAIAGFSGRTEDALKRAQTTRLEQRLAQGEVFSPEELQRIVKGIAGLPAEVKPVFAELDEFTKQFAKNVQDAFGQTILSSLKGDFKSIAGLWANMLLQMASQAVAADLTRALFPAMSKGGADGPSLTGSLGGLISGFFGGFFGGGRALGGPVAAGGMYPVNELGRPELLTMGNSQLLLMGKQSGQVSPLGGPGMPGGPTTTINQTVNIGGGVSVNDVMVAMRITKQETLQAVAEAQRRGYGRGMS